MSRLPNLILAGLGKAGTTSLFWYLSQHPEICPSDVKETGYFLAMSEADSDSTGALPPAESYAQHFHCEEQRYAMEATPQYFNGGRRLAGAIASALPDPRVVLTLRDPVARVWSVYRFARSNLQLPKSLSFEAYVEECLRLERQATPRRLENRHYWTIRAGMYHRFLPAWFEVFEPRSLDVVFFDDLSRDSLGAVRGLCRWLDIDDDCVRSFSLSVENQTFLYRNRTVQRVALKLNGERLLRNRRRLKRPLRAVYRTVNGSRKREAMSDEMRRRLDGVFANSRRATAELLRERGYAQLPAWLTEDPRPVDRPAPKTPPDSSMEAHSRDR